MTASLKSFSFQWNAGLFCPDEYLSMFSNGNTFNQRTYKTAVIQEQVMTKR